MSFPSRLQNVCLYLSRFTSDVPMPTICTEIWNLYENDFPTIGCNQKQSVFRGSPCLFHRLGTSSWFPRSAGLQPSPWSHGLLLYHSCIQSGSSLCDCHSSVMLPSIGCWYPKPSRTLEHHKSTSHSFLPGLWNYHLPCIHLYRKRLIT